MGSGAVSAALLTALAAAVLTGAAGSVLAVVLARRRLAWAVVAAPLAAVAAVAAGVLAGTRLMLFGPEPSRQLTSIVVVSAAVAVAVGVMVSWQVARAERAREAERMRQELVSHLSHDLRTPLAGIRAMSQALEDGVGSEREAYPRRMLAQIDQAITLADDLLSLSTYPLPRRPREEVRLHDLVSDAVAGLRAEADAEGVEIRGEVPAHLQVPADARELLRAVTNLLVNAVRHTPAGGEVLVSAREESRGRVVRVLVQDSCGGIDEETRRRMFDPLWRGDAARSPQRPGAGLGLAIVRSVASAHGGSVAARSAQDGCEVSFTLARPR
ncbi:histidine kinase [Brachybacterium phenoliresistens]|uniref:Sensor-like histidine kinase SenX3 n=1 Tax=Brachybacterium phenoliresistens TaxID=396014 RepID=Z9JN96_9MICO|nr:histidine kinase [Brachybacterium phenoliresistens]